ncbi:MAG: response regulator transcription factor [Peptoniphilaceae bacterium]|nr:response regulator transcription factor [Peptoniphilaceae bacterium]MDY6019138.1 response regulator transcription factor [Anaerococcus sp.]
MDNKWKIFIVEDDLVIGKQLGKFLSSWGYEILINENFEKVFETYKDFKPDLVLMDITLPFFNGYHWCSMIRNDSKVPIIFLSAADENLNLIMAVNMGADDYLVKPFNLDVLLAKIRALLRRSYEYQKDSDKIRYASMVFDKDKMTLTYDKQEIELTKNEYKILEILISNPGKVIKREDIMNKLWQSDEFIDENTLTVNVMRLRKKLKKYGLYDFIKTKKKVGYYVKD